MKIEAEWLKEQILKGKSILEIAQELRVASQTVYKYFHKYKIPLPSQQRKRPYRDRDWLAKEIQRHNVREVAQMCGVWPSTIINWLHKFGLPISPPKKPLNIEISPKTKEIVDGLLLNDAHVHKGMSIVIFDESKSYLEWVKKLLEGCNIPSKITKKKKAIV